MTDLFIIKVEIICKCFKFPALSLDIEILEITLAPDKVPVTCIAAHLSTVSFTVIHDEKYLFFLVKTSLSKRIFEPIGKTFAYYHASFGKIIN